MRISGLADGEHPFRFELNETFFAKLDESLIETGNVDATVTLEKKHGLLSLHFELEGKVEVTCDRCLEPFLTEIENMETIFVKMGEEPGEMDDNVIVIHKDDHEIEVGQLLYEFIVLALPYKKVHPENDEGVSACDPEMLRKLDDHMGGEAEEDKTDPRWDALKGLS